MENTPTPLKFPRRRTRMISFRVSDREFEQLKIQSEAEGARSISDFARLALCGSASRPAQSVDQGLQRLTGDVQQLGADIRRVAELLEARPPARPPISLTTRKSRGA